LAAEVVVAVAVVVRVRESVWELELAQEPVWARDSGRVLALEWVQDFR
jgi:hypothetical protein